MAGGRRHTGIVVVVDHNLEVHSLEVGIVVVVVVVVVVVEEEHHIHGSHGIAGLEKTS